MDLEARKPVFGGLRTTKAQTRLISAFVRLLETIISKLATSNFNILACMGESFQDNSWIQDFVADLSHNSFWFIFILSEDIKLEIVNI